ncbi:MAG: hypothetical protein RLZZ28_747 [Bacteroidota bacterium]
MKYTKISSWFLAISMCMFGVLKFVNPFKSWYRVQVTNSGLGQIAYSMGIMGEIAVGVTLFLCLIYAKSIPTKLTALLKGISFFTVIIMMLTGVYVHLNPNVPADVLPLKIKPPYIPVFFLLIALSNIVLLLRNVLKTKQV